MEATAPEKPKLTVISKDGVIQQAAQPVPDATLTEITTPAIIHQQTAQKIDVSLNDLGIPAPEGGVVTHPAEEKTLEKTKDIKDLVGEVVGEDLEIAHNWAEDKLISLFGTSKERTVANIGKNDVPETILKRRIKEEETVKTKDSEKVAA